MERFLNISKWAGYFLIALLFLAFISLLVYRVYLKNSTEIETPNGISSLEEIRLGALKQWIFIKGMDQNNPILLFLHGGPGEPMGGIPSSRIHDTGLIGHFTMVHWDQRGAGKSYSDDIPIHSMGQNQLV